jgi:hypothetical protein
MISLWYLYNFLKYMIVVMHDTYRAMRVNQINFGAPMHNLGPLLGTMVSKKGLSKSLFNGKLFRAYLKLH